MKRIPPLMFARKVLQRIPLLSMDVNCLHCLEFTCSGSPASDDRPAAVEIREGVPSDIPKMGECQNFPERIPERFEAGEHCVVATIGAKIVGYQWFCDKAVRIEERYKYEVKIPPDAVYGYDAFVLPAFRRLKIWRGFHTTYLKTLLPRLQRRRVIVMVDQGNIDSMKAHLHLGYRLYRKVYVVKVLGHSVCTPRSVKTSKDPLQAVPPAGTVEASSAYLVRVKNTAP
jgi:hypothetical protein